MPVVVTAIIRGRPEPQVVGDPLPANIAPSVEQWIRPAFWTVDPMGGAPDFKADVLSELERKLEVGVPFDRHTGERGVDDLIDRVLKSEEFAVRTLAILLSREAHRGRQDELTAIFESPGSKWEVVTFGGEYGGRGRKARLTLRQNGPVREVVAGLGGFGAPAHGHLERAILKLTQPGDKDPVGSYGESIKAVEAAARPTVSPKNPLATLGTMISAMRDKEEKWEVTLAEEKVDDVIRRAEILWKTPHERHGSDLPQPPVTIDQAQAGFNLALSLVDYFARGLIRRTEAT